MEFANKPRELLTAAAVFIATAVLVWFGNGLTPCWPLMWLAPLPVFWYSLRSSWWATALVACFGWLAGSASLLEYFGLVGMPPPVWLANFGGMGCLFATGVLLFRFHVLRGAVWTGIVALPSLWVSVDWLRYWVTPHGTAADLAYTQLDFLPFLQLAALTGPWGMSFLLLMAPAATAAALYLYEREPRRAIQIAGATGGALLVVFGFGIVRLNQPQQHTVRLGLIAADRSITQRAADTQQLLTEYAAHAKALALQGAKAIVMPEKNIVTHDADTDMKSSIFQPLANETGATIVNGELRVSPGVQYNRAEVYAPHSPVASYDKQHLLPPFESDQTPGKQRLTISRDGTRWGIAICKDMDFTSMGVGYGRLGAGLMLIPAWDFKLDRTWHGDMAIMRGVESGFSVARAAKDGYLLVSDSRGRVIARTRSDSAPFATLIADVPAEHVSTLFQQWHDWFAWVAVGLLAIVLLRVTPQLR